MSADFTLEKRCLSESFKYENMQNHLCKYYHEDRGFAKEVALKMAEDMIGVLQENKLGKGR